MGLRRATELAMPARKAGGDDSVTRDSEGRPELLTFCWLCNGEGRRPSPTGIEGRTVKCQGCRGEGIRVKKYKRVTSFIDVLDDKKFVQAWAERMVLVGVADDPSLLNRVKDLQAAVDAAVGSTDDEVIDLGRKAKDGLNRKAEVAKDLGGANRKSDQGSHLHELSEAVDRHEALPSDLPAADLADMEAYRLGTHGFLEIEHMEKLVVNEDLGTAGTPDRVSRWIGEGDLVAPDGTVIGRDELLITDLKTGRVDFGALKMAMQLAIYSRSELNVEGSPTREPMQNVNQRWGIIMHLPAGSGELMLYWADLTLGWDCVELAQRVHNARRQNKHALVPFTLTERTSDSFPSVA